MVEKKRPTMKEYFGETAKIYEKRMGLKKIKVKITMKAIELLSLPKNSYILDLGCGSGWSTETLYSQGYRVIGIDISKEMAKIAYQKGYIGIISDMRRIGLRDETFDGVVSISALNFISENCRTKNEIKRNYKAVAKELYRVLKPSGRAVLEYYPESKIEEEISMNVFVEAGFKGELIRNSYRKRLGQRFLNLVKSEAPEKKLFIKYMYFRF